MKERFGDAEDYAAVFVRDSGAGIPAEISSPIRQSDGKIVAVFASWVDVTDLPIPVRRGVSTLVICRVSPQHDKL